MARIFDAHCDTVFELSEKNLELSKNELSLDIERMSQYDTYIQVFAAFIDKKNIRRSPMNECLSLIDKYHTELEKNKGKILSILTKKDLKSAAERGGVYSILSIEGGEALEGNLSALSMYHKLGVRLITLTWNYANEIADGITESRGGGLTDFGRQVVSLMEEMGIIIDVSHLSEAGFWDVAKCTCRPFIASHSCVKALCGHCRNLTDEQIAEIIKRKGVVGVNFYPEFLSDTGVCGIDAIYKHIEYILNMGGENSVGLGSDFDGVGYLPHGMRGTENIPDLVTFMEKKGVSGEIIDKVTFNNFYRVFCEIL